MQAIKVIAILLIVFAVHILLRAWQRHKKQLKQCGEVDITKFDFAYQLECDFGKVCSNKKEVVYNISGKSWKVKRDNNLCCLTVFDNETCVLFFFNEGFYDKDCDENTLVFKLLNYLDDKNLVIL